jgi:replicative DNA helicase
MKIATEYLGEGATRQGRQEASHRRPHCDPKTEQSILGCALLSASEAMPQLLERITDDEFFTDARHRLLWRTMKDIYASKPTFDPVILSAALEASGNLQAAGGLEYVSSLPDTTPSAANLSYYLEIAKDHLIARKVAGIATGLISELQDSPDVRPAVSKATAALAKIADATSTQRAQPKRISDFLPRVIERIRDFQRGKPQTLGLKTMWNYLDNMTCGIGPQDYWILAGRPGTGKSAFALNLCESLSVDRKIPTAIFSLEMGGQSLATRALFMAAKCDAMKYRNGFLKQADFPSLDAAEAKLGSAPIWVLDEVGLTIDRLEIQARRLAREHGIKLFVLDYIQLMRGRQGARYEKRVDELADVSRSIMQLKKELSVPWLVLAQMNRDFDREPRRPHLADLKDCGNLEQDADLVAFLWPEDMSICDLKPDSDKARSKLAFLDSPLVRTLPTEFSTHWKANLMPINLSVQKQREGPTGDVEMIRIKPWMRFEDTWKPPSGASKECPHGDVPFE